MLGFGQGSLYKQLYSDDTLTEAWRKVRVGTEMAGVDGVTVSQFQARLFANLKALQTDLRKRRFSPQPVKRLSIPKADGGQRPLGILTVRDRIVQRAALIVVEPLFEAGFEACSHGFRKGRSVQTALTQLSQLINLGYGWMVDFDIASCFDTINTRRLFGFIKDRVGDREIRRLMRAWLDVEAAAIPRLGLRRKRQTVGILQGGILSPLFANVYLDRFDKAMLKRGAKLVRYADEGWCAAGARPTLRRLSRSCRNSWGNSIWRSIPTRPPSNTSTRASTTWVSGSSCGINPMAGQRCGRVRSGKPVRRRPCRRPHDPKRSTP